MRWARVQAVCADLAEKGKVEEGAVQNELLAAGLMVFNLGANMALAGEVIGGGVMAEGGSSRISLS